MYPTHGILTYFREHIQVYRSTSIRRFGDSVASRQVLGELDGIISGLWALTVRNSQIVSSFPVVSPWAMKKGPLVG